MITFAKLVSPSQYKSKRKEIEEEKEVKIFLKLNEIWLFISLKHAVNECILKFKSMMLAIASEMKWFITYTVLESSTPENSAGSHFLF